MFLWCTCVCSLFYVFLPVFYYVFFYICLLTLSKILYYIRLYLEAGDESLWSKHVNFPSCPHDKDICIIRLAAAVGVENIFTFYCPQVSCCTWFDTLWADVGRSLSLWFHLQPKNTHHRKNHVYSQSLFHFWTVYWRSGAGCTRSHMED